MIHPALVHDHEDVVDARNTDLSAPSAACNREEGRRAPSSFCTAGRYPFSELRGHHEPRFDLVRNHGNALGVFNNSSGIPLSGAFMTSCKTSAAFCRHSSTFVFAALAHKGPARANIATSGIS